MRIAKLLASSTAGFFVFLVAVVYVGGIAMAVPIPASYYAALRPLGGSGLALAIVSLLVWGLPVALVVGMGFFVMLRVLRAPLGLLSLFGVAGMVIAYLVLTDFQGFMQAPFAWWGVPHVLAPWIGAVTAIWLSRRSLASRAEPVA
jgi:hypothetical protein